ncbi:MAG: 6-phosphofructokinase [Bdellovibrionota bacterium]|jgi:phosphofructokinase-like protein
MSKQTIGILTGGGDCPGLNAVIRGVTKSAINRYGMQVIGFYDSFLGMIEKRYEVLDSKHVSGILTQGGTILGSTNQADPFHMPNSDGTYSDLSQRCIDLYHELNLSALVCVGGDGTMTLAGKLAERGINVIGVPKTIDKDLMETDATFGFDSALVTATEAIDKLHTTAHAHHRIMAVEVMGRNAGWLALEAGIAGGGDTILIPEMPYNIEIVASSILDRYKEGKRFSIVVVAEGAKPLAGEQTYQQDTRNQRRLGGISHIIAESLSQLTGLDSRVTILGHLQRGGTPSPHDRVLATQFATKAVELIVSGNFNKMVALKGVDIVDVPLEKVMGKQRTVPLDHPLISAARAVGTCFGI